MREVSKIALVQLEVGIQERFCLRGFRQGWPPNPRPASITTHRRTAWKGVSR